MKTKHTNKLLVLIISVMMIVTLFAGLSITASAEETGTTTDYTAPAAKEAKIYGANVNLGGDISMKYYVELGEGVTINQVKLRTVFLGVEKYLAAAETPVETDDNRTLYVFTLDSITPQCMGDPIDAQLICDGVPLTCEDSSMIGYSVKKNLENTYKNTSDENLKCLILDTLKYGRAAQKFKYYKTDAFVTNGELADAIAVDFDHDGFYNQGHTYRGATDDIHLAEDGGITVNFSSVNTLKFKYVAPEGTKVTINGEEVTPTKEGDYWIVETNAIAPTGFYDLYTVVIADTVTVTYSVNEYCGFSFSNSLNPGMTDLALALYNYGDSAHIYDGTGHLEGAPATCSQGAYCKICGLEYGDPLPHNYSYTADANTITESCSNPLCNHSKTITLKAPENLVYDGNAKVAIVDGALDVAYELSYNAQEPIINAGNYTATLTAGGKSVNLAFTIEKADSSCTAPTDIKNLVYNGTAQNLINAGEAVGGTLVYSLTENGDFTSNIPTGTNAGDYTVWYYVQGDDNHNNSAKASVTVNIAKAEATITTTPTAKSGLTYNGTAQDLISAGSANIGTMVYSLTGEEGSFTENIPMGTTAGAYTVYYKVLSDDNVTGTEVASMNVINIAKAALTVTANDHVIEYLDAPAGNGVTYAGFVTGEDASVLGGSPSYDFSYAQYQDIGNYTITPKGLTSDNYEITYVIGTLTVKAKDLQGVQNAPPALMKFMLDQSSFVYDGTEKTPNVTMLEYDGIAIGTYVVTYENNVNVGVNARIIVTFNGNYTGTAVWTFVITQDPDTTEFDGEWITVPKTEE